MADEKTIPYDPNQKDKLDQLVLSAFSETVRKQRRNLLLVSTVSLFITVANVIPSSAGLFGMSFSDVSPHVALGFLFLVILYFLLAFWLYASPEYRSALRAKQDQGSDRFTLSASHGLWWIDMQNLFSRGRYLIWLGFEYVLPIIVGVLALAAVVWRFAASGTVQ